MKIDFTISQIVRYAFTGGMAVLLAATGRASVLWLVATAGTSSGVANLREAANQKISAYPTLKNSVRSPCVSSLAVPLPRWLSE